MKQSPAGEFHPRAHGRRVDGGLPRGCGQGRDGHRLRCSEPPQQPPEGTLPPWLEGAGQEAELGRGLPSEAAAVEGMQPTRREGDGPCIRASLLSSWADPKPGEKGAEPYSSRELAALTGTEGSLLIKSPGCALSSGT